MQTIEEFLNALGGLHDAGVLSINWQIGAKTLEFTFDDLYANFRGLSEYPGRRKGAISLKGVGEVVIEIESTEGMKVFEFLPVEGRPGWVTAKFSPGGHITAQFTAAEHPMNELLPPN